MLPTASSPRSHRARHSHVRGSAKVSRAPRLRTLISSFTFWRSSPPAHTSWPSVTHAATLAGEPRRCNRSLRRSRGIGAVCRWRSLDDKTCECRKLGHLDATWEYSCNSPPSRARRMTLEFLRAPEPEGKREREWQAPGGADWRLRRWSGLRDCRDGC